MLHQDLMTACQVALYVSFPFQAWQHCCLQAAPDQATHIVPHNLSVNDFIARTLPLLEMEKDAEVAQVHYHSASAKLGRKLCAVKTCISVHGNAPQYACDIDFLLSTTGLAVEG